MNNARRREEERRNEKYKNEQCSEIWPETCMHTNIYITGVLEKKGEENIGRNSGPKLTHFDEKH